MLTQQEQNVIRLCHHEFKGLSRKRAAKELGITESRVGQLLRSTKRKTPQLFPILTYDQNKIYRLVNQGWTHEKIAHKFNTTVITVNNIVAGLKRKGVVINKRPKTVRYEKWMDKQVVERF